MIRKKAEGLETPCLGEERGVYETDCAVLAMAVMGRQGSLTMIRFTIRGGSYTTSLVNQLPVDSDQHAQLFCERLKTSLGAFLQLATATP